MADDESAPKPGHFLPGGAGDRAAEDGVAPRPASSAQRLAFGKARPVPPQVDLSLNKTAAHPADPSHGGNHESDPKRPSRQGSDPDRAGRGEYDADRAAPQGSAGRQRSDSDRAGRQRSDPERAGRQESDVELGEAHRSNAGLSGPLDAEPSPTAGNDIGLSSAELHAANPGAAERSDADSSHDASHEVDADADLVTRRFGAPPPAPSPGAPPPGTPLSGTHQVGETSLAGWQTASSRSGQFGGSGARGLPPVMSDGAGPSDRAGGKFCADPPPVKPERRFSKPAIAAFCAITLLAVSGGAFASMKLIDSYDNLVDNPLAGPTVKSSGEAQRAPAPEPTVTVTVKPVPDAVRVKQNKLYSAGRLASLNCKEPSVKPANKAAMLRFYRAVLPCLNRTWAPLVRKAGYEFREPTLVMYDKRARSACSGETDLAFYCGSDETITMQWARDLAIYKKDKLFARVSMMDTLAHEYGHHVQMLTHIMISSDSREGWATTKAAKLQERRRLELQASCFAASFLGANKKSLPLTGHRLNAWQYLARHSGDEYNPSKVRDHGSRKNNWLWAEPAFQSANPKSCNTFAAPAARVS